MSEWLSVNNSLPSESDELWYEIKKGENIIGYPVRFWESDSGDYFVNACFGKEQDVTHWRPSAR